MRLSNLKKIVSSPYFTYSFIFISFILFGYRMFHYIKTYTPNLLFQDEWDNIYYLFLNYKDLLTVFLTRHDSHRIGTGLLIELFLVKISSWNILYETMCVGIIISIASFFALLLKKRIVGSLNVYDAIIPILFFNLYQNQNFIWGGFQIGVLPFLFLFLVAYIRLLPLSIKRDICLLCITIASVFSSFHGLIVGVFVYISFILDLLGSKSVRQKIWYIGLLALTYLICISYFLNFGNLEARTYESTYKFNLMSFPYMVTFFTVQMNALFGVHQHGFVNYIVPLLLFVSTYCFNKIIRKSKKVYVYSSLFLPLIYSIIFLLFILFSRAQVGLVQASTSRYITNLIPLYFYLYVVISFIAKKWKNTYIVPFVVGLYLFFSFKNDYQNFINRAYYRDHMMQWKQCFLLYEDINRCDQVTGITVYPNFANRQGYERMEILKKYKYNLYSNN